MKRYLIATLIVMIALTAGCNKDVEQKNLGKKKESVSVNEEDYGEIKVSNGETLERDIIPKIAEKYKLSEDEVKEVFSSAKSELIADDVEGFRRMEGMFIPGVCKFTEKDLKLQMEKVIKEAEMRYGSVLSEVEQKNSLNKSQRIILASIVEAETIAGENRQETADVFLNRLSEGGKLQSCVTAEYALGYQRPYLTFDDIEVDSRYNTYENSGLPVGAISTFSDESLKFASGKSTNTSLQYFFYDYVSGNMHFFSDYEKFNIDGKEVLKKFDSESKVGKFDKINKQELYGK